LQYATQQAQTETSTPATNPITGGSGGFNLVPLAIGGLVVLVIIVFGWSMIATSRRKRRKSALPDVAMMPPAGSYGTMPAAAPYSGGPGQSYGTLPVNAPGAAQSQIGHLPPAPVPQTPPYYPAQAPYPQAARSQMQSSAPQPAFRPQVPSPAPQPAFRPQPPAQAPAAGSMAAFGAPSMPGALPVTPQASVSSASQWRIWPCGHTNRFDASFCGTCGESAPPAPIVRRLEQ